MPRSKRNIMAIAEETSHPPSDLTPTQSIAQVIKAEGNNLYLCSLPNQNSKVLAELPSRFRNTIWLKRNSYVLVDTKETSERDNKIYGKICNIVRDERTWRKESYWPEEFVKISALPIKVNEEKKLTSVNTPSLDSENK